MASTAAESSASRLISLRHITQPAPAKPTRIAWPGGKIGSNKDEAVQRFLEKKRERGDSLTTEQLELLRRFHSSDAAAEAERIAAGEPAPEATTADVSAGSKRRRDPHAHATAPVRRASAAASASAAAGRASRNSGPPISSKQRHTQQQQHSPRKGAALAASAPAAPAAAPPKAAPAPPPAPPSVVDKLSMSLDQLAALRKKAAAAPAAAGAAHKKRK